jgi:hypothetical protein
VDSHRGLQALQAKGQGEPSAVRAHPTTANLNHEPPRTHPRDRVSPPWCAHLECGAHEGHVHPHAGPRDHGKPKP